MVPCCVPIGDVMSQVAAPARPAASAAAIPGVVNKSRWRIFFLVLAAAVLLGAAVLSLGVGAKFIPATTVLEAFTNPQDTADHAIILQNRLPRTLMGMAVGIALGVAGALIQAITRNPLADPGILGVNAGASFAMVIAIGVFGVGSLSGYIWFAFLGAILTTGAVYLIGTSGRNVVNPIRLTLAGVALGAVLTGIGSGLTLLNPKAFDHLRSWSIGSLDTRSMESVFTVLPFMGVGAAGGIVLRPRAQRRGAGRRPRNLPRGQRQPHPDPGGRGHHPPQRSSNSRSRRNRICGAHGSARGPLDRGSGPTLDLWPTTRTALPDPAAGLRRPRAGSCRYPARLPVGVVTAFIGAPVLIALARRRKVSGL